MLTEERHNKILEALKTKRTVTVAEMTEYTGASESTIRRDLTALDEMGKIKQSSWRCNCNCASVYCR